MRCAPRWKRARWCCAPSRSCAWTRASSPARSSRSASPRRTRSRLHDVAVGDLHVRAVLLGEPASQLLREHHAAVAAAGAADAHGQVALTLRPVLGNQELEQRLQAGEELLRLHPLQHPVRDPRIRSRIRLEPLDEVRVREEAHVEHQVARLRDPVAEPEAEQGHVQLVVLPRSAELRRDRVAQLVHVHPRGVDDLIRQRAQLGEHAPLLRDALLDALGRRGLPRPGKTGHQHDAVRVRAAPGWIVLRDLGHYSTSSPIPRVRVACAISRESFSWNSFAEWCPCSLSRWLRAATSTMVARFRPGRTGITSSGTSMSRMVYFCSSTPRRSYSTLSSHSTSSTTISTFFRSRTAETPNRSLMLMMPIPRISMWCLMISDPLP